MSRPPKPGFCFRVIGLDGRTKIFVNVCGSDEVGMPQAHSGVPVTAEFIDAHGIDNLQVPIAVGNPTRDTTTTSIDSSSRSKDSNVAATADAPPQQQQQLSIFVDVVVHRELTRRCASAEHHQKEHLISRLVPLALHWVQREAGIMADLRTAKVLQKVAYKTPPSSSAAAVGAGGTGDVLKHAKALYEAAMSEASSAQQRKQPKQEGEEEQTAADIRLPQQFMVDPIISSNAPPMDEQQMKKPPMIVEVSSSTNEGSSSSSSSGGGVIRKGFLLKQDRPALYGPAGTPEGVLPDGAGDPLGHLPKSLRDKCKVIDARNMQQLPQQSSRSGCGEGDNKSSRPTAQQSRVEELEDSPQHHHHQQQPEIAQAAAAAAQQFAPVVRVEGGLMVIEVAVPHMVQGMKELSATIDCRSIEITHIPQQQTSSSLGIPLLHPCRIDLPEPGIVDSEATAKFHKSKRVLIIRAPLSQPQQ